jgi:hypothetical protein
MALVLEDFSFSLATNMLVRMSLIVGVVAFYDEYFFLGSSHFPRGPF